MAARKKGKEAAPKKQSLSVEAYLERLSALTKRARGDEDISYVLAADEEAGLQPVKEWISTGLLALDRFIGGGWPIGRIVEIAAWEGIGKTTLIDQAIAQAQRAGVITVLIDSEKARDREYTVRLGVDLNNLIVSQVDTLEQGFEVLDNVLAVQESCLQEGLPLRPVLFFWDSLGGTPTKAEVEGAAYDRHVGVHALMIKQNFRRACIRLNELRGSLIFANQFYEKIGGMGGLATTGGSGVRYYSSLRLWLNKGNYLKSGTSDVGHIVHAKLRKTRLTKPKEAIELGLLYGAGFDNAFTLYEWGKVRGVSAEHRWIQQRGSWCYLTRPDTGETVSFQGTYLGFGALLREDPALYQQLATLYLQDAE